MVREGGDMVNLAKLAAMMWAVKLADSPEQVAELFRANEKKFAELFQEEPPKPAKAEVMNRPW